MHEMDARVSDVATRGDVAEQWSFVFWVGVVGAIAMLASALR